MKKKTYQKRLWGIQMKLLMYVMLLITVVMVLVSITISVIVTGNTRESLDAQYGYVSDKLYASFDNLYENLNVVTETAITNTNIQNSLKNKELTAYEKEVVARTLQFLSDYDTGNYVYIDNKGNIYSMATLGLNLDKFYDSQLYKGLGDEYSQVKLFWSEPVFKDGEGKALYAGRYVRQFERNYEPGVLYLKLNSSIFRGLVEETGDTTPAYFLLDGEGQICYREYSAEYGLGDHTKQRIEEQLVNARESKNGRFQLVLSEGTFYGATHEKTGFTLASFVPKEVLNQAVIQIQQVILLIFLGVLVLAFILSRYLAETFAKPIRYISNLMENFDDSRLYERAILNTNTELDQIGNSYNEMLTQIGELLAQVKYKERERRKAELDTLMYQIQPHFLYNTLDTVYMLARISGEQTIMKMIQALSKYLRVILSNGAQEIPIEEEIQHVKAYLDIQQIRNSDLFAYEIECEESLKQVRVLKMILQPLVENAIKHAFDQCREQAHIWITIREIHGEVIFTVANDGTVMDDKTKNRMNRLETMSPETIATLIEQKQGGYGISNVVRRLRLGYGERVRFYYMNTGNKTSCVIRIRKEMMREDEEKKM